MQDYKEERNLKYLIDIYQYDQYDFILAGDGNGIKDRNEALDSAIQNGHVVIVNYLIKNYSDEFDLLKISKLLARLIKDTNLAVESKNLVLSLLLEDGLKKAIVSNKPYAYNVIVEMAKNSIIMIQDDKNLIDVVKNCCFILLAQEKQPEVVSFLMNNILYDKASKQDLLAILEKKSDDYVKNIIEDAVTKNYQAVAGLMENFIGNKNDNTSINFINKMFLTASKYGRREIVQDMIKNMKNLDILTLAKEAMLAAAKNGHANIVHDLLPYDKSSNSLEVYIKYFKIMQSRCLPKREGFFVHRPEHDIKKFIGDELNFLIERKRYDIIDFLLENNGIVKNFVKEQNLEIPTQQQNKSEGEEFNPF